jgi:hypothetical protein
MDMCYIVGAFILTFTETFSEFSLRKIDEFERRKEPEFIC